MDDYISLCEAQDAMTAENLIRNLDQVENGEAKRFARAAVRVLERLKPADVRPVKRGRWNRYEHDREFWANYCSACNIYLPPGLDWEPNFCPNCGAEMGSADG